MEINARSVMVIVEAITAILFLLTRSSRMFLGSTVLAYVQDIVISSLNCSEKLPKLFLELVVFSHLRMKNKGWRWSLQVTGYLLNTLKALIEFYI